ncbi:MAG TPA: TonB-dependent receptor plug domain-containing protein, partial [Longimicrobiales bacterium]
MTGPIPWRALSALLAAGTVLVLPGAGTAQQPMTGRVVGRVVEAGSGRAITGAQVFIAGTRVGALTNATGAYEIAAVPVGQQTAAVQMLGYGQEKQDVVVRAGQSARADFEVRQVAISLDEVVVTGAGVATQKRMLGNTVATVDAARIMENSAIQDVSSLLQARIPGVIGASTGGLAGEGMRISIRGNASLTQYNQPVVYVDGVRVDNGGGWGPGVSAGGGGDPTRLSDINPEDIARVEVLKGAAAATLYGTEASSGVIQIFTKHGSAGATHWTFQIQEGMSGYPHGAYEQHAGFAVANGPTTTGTHVDQGATYLSQYWGKNIQPFQPFTVDLVPLLYKTGHDQTYSMSVEGGTP